MRIEEIEELTKKYQKFKKYEEMLKAMKKYGDDTKVVLSHVDTYGIEELQCVDSYEIKYLIEDYYIGKLSKIEQEIKNLTLC